MDESKDSTKDDEKCICMKNFDHSTHFKKLFTYFRIIPPNISAAAEIKICID